MTASSEKRELPSSEGLSMGTPLSLETPPLLLAFSCSRAERPEIRCRRLAETLMVVSYKRRLGSLAPHPAAFSTPGHL